VSEEHSRTEERRGTGTDGNETGPAGDRRDPTPPADELHERPPADDEPLAEEPPTPPARIPPVVVPRWVQLVALPLGVLALWSLARAAGSVLLLFIVAGVIALILNPLVSLLQGRVRLPRGLAVATVFIAFFGSVVGFGVLVATPVSDQVSKLRQDVPEFIDSANESLASLQSWLDDRGVDLQVKDPGQSALETLQSNLVEGSGDIVSFTGDVLQRIVRGTFALVLIIVVTIYMLLHGQRIGALVRALMPAGDGTPEDDYPTRAQKAVFGYVRGQVLFSLLMGLGAGVSLWILGAVGIFPDGKTYALFFGAFLALMEFIPYVGPVLGAAPPILVALFQDPLTAVWVALLFVALQQIEGHIVAPLVFGHSLRINPLVVIFALLVGAELYGIVGALVALPVAAILRETAIYLRHHLVLEPWGTPTPAAVLAGRSPPPATATRRCPECETEAELSDAFCRSCGASLSLRSRASP
jgi:putative heme transporter